MHPVNQTGSLPLLIHLTAPGWPVWGHVAYTTHTHTHTDSLTHLFVMENFKLLQG